MVLTQGFALYGLEFDGFKYSHGFENHVPTCKVKIKARFARNDPNGSPKSIYTPSISFANSPLI